MSRASFTRRTLVGAAVAAAIRADAKVRIETLTDWLHASPEMRKAALKSCLERIRNEDRSIHAWVQVSPQEPTGEGPLSGIPFGAKDIIETRGLATEYGSAVYKGRIGQFDAEVVQDLRKRGAILLGKTHTTAFAMRDPGPTRNPRDLKHTPGGSSSGSAAAVAAGMVPFAIGTQTGGSVIRPASYCGITGFKGTFGLFPLQGVLQYAKSLDTLGYFTHTPADMLLLWKALGHSMAPEQEVRFGVPDPIPEVDAPMSAAFQATVRRLREKGVALQNIDISPMLTSLLPPHRTISMYEAAEFHAERVKEHGDRLGTIAPFVRDGLKVTKAQYDEAKQSVATYRVRFNKLFEDTPVMLTPAAPGPALLGLTSTGDPRINAPWTALGTPAVTFPMRATGLPLGLQLTAAPGQDARLLRAADRLHRLLAVV